MHPEGGSRSQPHGHTAFSSLSWFGASSNLGLSSRSPHLHCQLKKKIWHIPVFTLLAFILSLLQVNCKWLLKVKNKTKHPSWPIPGYAYNTGQQKGMKGDLTRPLLWMYVLPSDPVPEDSGHTVLSMLVQEIPLQDSYPKWPCRSLRFSRFWHTEFRIDLGPVTVIFHALDTWSLLYLWLYDHRYHSPLNRNHTSSLSCLQEQGSHPHKPTSERVSFTG